MNCLWYINNNNNNEQKQRYKPLIPLNIYFSSSFGTDLQE